VTSPELDNLARVGKLKTETAAPAEIEGLLRSGRARLADAKNRGLAPESRFDLAYNAAHALALAALRKKGYRSDNRYLVFQALPHTLGLGPEVWRVLAKCHERRNAAEYEGSLEIDDRLLADLIAAADAVLAAVSLKSAPSSKPPRK
jgi:hypothetical protein